MRSLSREHAASELIRAARVLSETQCLPATDGNLSARLDDRHVLITKSGIEKRELSLASFVELMIEDKEAGEGSSEWLVHRALYLSRAEVYCVLHAHSPYLTTFAAAQCVPEADLLAEAKIAVGEMVVVPYFPPGTDALATALVAASSTARVYLLANHGVVAVGETVRDALHRLERAEFAARIDWQSRLLGERIRIPASEAE